MRFFNNLKRNLTLKSEVLIYVNRYHSIYKRVISEAKRERERERERERMIGCLKSAKYSTKVMW